MWRYWKSIPHPSEEQGMSAVHWTSRDVGAQPPSWPVCGPSPPRPIWHRGWLCKTLRARQRPIHLRSREPLPWSSVIPWELGSGAFLLFCFDCVWAKIKGGLCPVCQQVEGCLTATLVRVAYSGIIPWKCKNDCMLQVQIWCHFPDNSFLSCPISKFGR